MSSSQLCYCDLVTGRCNLGRYYLEICESLSCRDRVVCIDRNWKWLSVRDFVLFSAELCADVVRPNYSLNCNRAIDCFAQCARGDDEDAN